MTHLFMEIFFEILLKNSVSAFLFSEFSSNWIGYLSEGSTSWNEIDIDTKLDSLITTKVLHSASNNSGADYLLPESFYVPVRRGFMTITENAIKWWGKRWSKNLKNIIASNF